MLLDFIFAGTGTSGRIPEITCLTATSPDCRVCISGLDATSKNRRRNTSGFLRYLHSDGSVRNILIDCGKSFYESALHICVKHKIRKIDAVLLTHGHVDAILGIDDLRQWTHGYFFLTYVSRKFKIWLIFTLTWKRTMWSKLPSHTASTHQKQLVLFFNSGNFC
jgi:phosphoribosyl 1,2-cyclic phosphodiesterase